MKPRFLIFLSITMILASATGRADGNTLAGSEWGLADGDNRFVQFGGDGKVSGHAGCNRFFTSYRQDGRKLAISDIATTRKFCGEATMQREREWLDLLKQARSIELTHLKLVLYGADGTRLETLKRRVFD